jgi:carbamoylphosphate synthase large subunit
LYEVDEEARQARDAAEAQFDEADRRLSTSMACVGAQMALDAWALREKVIRKAEALSRKK